LTSYLPTRQENRRTAFSNREWSPKPDFKRQDRKKEKKQTGNVTVPREKGSPVRARRSGPKAKEKSGRKSSEQPSQITSNGQGFEK